MAENMAKSAVAVGGSVVAAGRVAVPGGGIAAPVKRWDSLRHAVVPEPADPPVFTIQSAAVTVAGYVKQQPVSDFTVRPHKNRVMPQGMRHLERARKRAAARQAAADAAEERRAKCGSCIGGAMNDIASCFVYVLDTIFMCC